MCCLVFTFFFFHHYYLFFFFFFFFSSFFSIKKRSYMSSIKPVCTTNNTMVMISTYCLYTGNFVINTTDV